MDPQNPNSTDPNNPSVINPVPGTPSPVSPPPVQPDLSSIGLTPPPPVDPIPPATAPPPADSSQIPTYTPPSWMNPAAPSEPNPTTPPVEPIPPLGGSGLDPIPTYMPPSAPAPEMTPAPIEPEIEPIPVGPNPITEPSLSQGAPVDLSQLISNAQQQIQTENPIGMPPNSAPSATETIVSAPAATTETAATESHGFPKWLIGVAVGLLILVVGASAYFILGVGQSNTQTSLPATQTTGRLATPAPIPSPRSVVPPQSATLPATSSAQPVQQQATSAADLIRLRQQGK